jgi:hypothetical protein
MNQIILGILILLTSTIGLANGATEAKKKATSKKELKKTTREQIMQLHNGVLLVRLKTRNNSIEALRKIGRD